MGSWNAAHSVPNSDGRPWWQFLGCAATWLLAWRNDFGARPPTEVDPGIWIGGVPSRRRWAALRSAGVRAVVALTGEFAPPLWLRGASGLLWLPIKNCEAPSDRQLAVAAAFLNDASTHGMSVLIYCGAGSGRAPTLWVGWRIVRGEAASVALARIRAARPAASPTPCQSDALERWASGGAPSPPQVDA